MEISQLVAKREQLQYELNTENQRGAVKDGAKVTQLENDIKAIDITIEEQSKAEELQAVTADAAKFMDSLDFGGDDPKDLFINYTEEKATLSYEYVNAVIQNAVVEMKKVDLLEIKKLKADNAALQEKLNQSEEANEALKHIVDTAKLDINDANSKRDAAAKALDEANEEIARLNGHLDDLRKEIAVGSANAAKVVEVDVRSAHEKLLEQRRKEEEAKPVIYNIRWKDNIRRDTYLANLAENDEQIEFPYFAMNGDIKEPSAMKGRYRVVTSEEAPSFRTAYIQEQERNHEDMAQHSSVEDGPVTVPAFRDEDTNSTTSGVDQADASVEVARPSVEKRLEALELAVFGSVRDAA
ncbi:hypothetical protein [Paenibacillus odorifer]|uniref:hypothetical protein n=1 Tax=Paenibacillus odorifer TaxID=189426 RepID=UPI00096FA9E5|nr:hypothetical protein [Paenibacillus odorifer]OMD92728.1 hypothetical protein BSK67_18365 [Paenibacillus odorifer]